MPDRYGDSDDELVPVPEPDPRELDLELAAEIARLRRSHLSVARPMKMTPEAREEARRQRIAAQQAEAARRIAGIPLCEMCDSDGYKLNGMVCDHVDRTSAVIRGRYLVRAAMGWNS